MGTTRLFMRGIPALSLLAVLLSYGWAADRSIAANGQSYRDANAAMPRASAARAPGEAMLKRASRVMNTKVKSPQGESLGRVDDLVLTPDLNGISYVAVSSGGFLGMGGTLHAVPWSALSESVNNTYVIPVSAQQFKQSRGFRASSWPSSAETGWTTAEGQEPVYQGQAPSAMEDAKYRRFSHIKGSKVKASNNQSAGSVHDLVIVMDTGRIAYTVVSYGGVVGLGARYAAVPEGAVTLEPARRVAMISGTREALHANSFTPNQWPDLANVTVARQLDRTYGVSTSETALGYVPAEGGAVAAAPRAPAKPSGRAAKPPSGTTPATPAAPAMPAAQPTAAELTGTFNPSKITTIDGTVVDEGKFRATPSGPEMLWMRVRTSGGQMHWVNLGPRTYISSQDFYVVPGDTVHLSGSEVTATAPGRQVFLPTQITFNNQTLRLRSDNGTPLWEGQSQQTGTAQPPSEAQKQSQAGAAGAGGAAALGYTPAQEQGAPGTPQAPTQFTPPGLIPSDAFDLSNPRTIEGTVIEVGKSQVPTGGQDIIWLRVRTTDNQSMNVQVGPRDYVSKQNFLVVNGDRVRMTGWNARALGAPGVTPVFVLAEISQDGHTLQLRNRNGDPLWTATGMPGQPQTGTTQQGAMGQTQNAQTSSQPPRTAAEPNEPNQP